MRAIEADGRTFLDAEAWGKHLFAEFSGDRYLHVHLGLIGSFDVTAYAPDAAFDGSDDTAYPIPPAVGAVRLRLLTPRHLADLRGATLCRTATPEEVDAVVARLGPDPLRPDADPERAWRRISTSARPIADLLMDQSVLAGLGQIVTMADQVEDVLAGDYDPALVPTSPTGVSAWRPNPHGALERRYYVYKRDGMPCLTCGSRVRTTVVAGRNLFWCGRCQRRR